MKSYKIAFPLLLIFLTILSLSCRHKTDKDKDLSKKVRTVFIGNSIIEYWVMTHPNFFSENNYLAKGVAGETTTQILSRFTNDVIEINPESVFIEGGINDIAENVGTYNPDKTFENITLMAEAANEKGIKVFISSLLPTDSIHWNQNITNISNKVQELNNRIKNYAEENGFTYVDFHAEMVDSNGKTMIPEYTSDGIHTTEKGYLIMEPIIQNAINKTLSQDK